MDAEADDQSRKTLIRTMLGATFMGAVSAVGRLMCESTSMPGAISASQARGDGKRYCAVLAVGDAADRLEAWMLEETERLSAAEKHAGRESPVTVFTNVKPEEAPAADRQRRPEPGRG